MGRAGGNERGIGGQKFRRSWDPDYGRFQRGAMGVCTRFKYDPGEYCAVSQRLRGVRTTTW